MSGVLKIEIKESEAELLELLKSQREGKRRQRIQMLYWLKTSQAETEGHLAVMLGYHRTTVARWLAKYRQGGIKTLLEITKSPGRKKAIPDEIKEQLKLELKDPEGFRSYGEIQTWLKVMFELEVSYTVVHKLVRYQLKSKLKVPRPVNIKQVTGAVEEFKKNLSSSLTQILKPLENLIKNYRKVRYWCQDESRIGLITMKGRKITCQGVQPIGVEQLTFDYLWLYGLVEPLTGESFFYEFSHLDSIGFERYLELFAEEMASDFHIIQLDNGGLHQALNLAIPENVVLLFQPPYSPQVNPIERLWKELKKDLKWEIFPNLEHLRTSLAKILNDLTSEAIASLTGWQFIRDALSVANI
jgi:transposase